MPKKQQSLVSSLKGLNRAAVKGMGCPRLPAEAKKQFQRIANESLRLSQAIEAADSRERKKLRARVMRFLAQTVAWFWTKHNGS